MRTVAGYKITFVEISGRMRSYVTTEAIEEDAKASFNTKFPRADVLFVSRLDAKALRAEGVEPGGSKEY